MVTYYECEDRTYFVWFDVFAFNCVGARFACDSLRVWSVMSEKHVYSFGKDHAGNDVTEVAGASVEEAKWIVGGKGANLAEMSKIGLPVPPGFSITCNLRCLFQQWQRLA